MLAKFLKQYFSLNRKKKKKKPKGDFIKFSQKVVWRKRNPHIIELLQFYLISILLKWRLKIIFILNRISKLYLLYQPKCKFLFCFKLAPIYFTFLPSEEMGIVSISIPDFTREGYSKLCFIQWCSVDFVIVSLALNSRHVFTEPKNNSF